MEAPSFKSSLDSAILKLSSSGLSSPMDLIPGEEAVNTAGPPFGGGISIPIRRYFLLLLLIHVCQFQNTESIITSTGQFFSLFNLELKPG